MSPAAEKFVATVVNVVAGVNGEVPTDKRLEIVMMALADMCQALATDGTPESTEEFYRERDAGG